MAISDSILNTDLIKDAREFAGRSVSGVGSVFRFEYPDPPQPTERLVLGPQTWMPQKGVYFVWGDDMTCLYVGKSVIMPNRCAISKTLKYGQTVHSRSDMAMFAGELCSALAFEEDLLMFAEFYYIGLLRPIRNCNNALRGLWTQCNVRPSKTTNFDPEVRKRSMEAAKFYKEQQEKAKR